MPRKLGVAVTQRNEARLGRWVLSPIAEPSQIEHRRWHVQFNRKELTMPSGYVMPYSVPSHSRPHRPHRPSLALRARVWLKTIELDAALAGGDDPTRTPELALRSEQLAGPKKHEQLAETILRVITIADRHKKEAVITPLAPFKPWQIDANRSLLLALAERLRDNRPHALQGVAMTALMLEDGTGPLLFGTGPATLERAVRACLSALDA
jgi:hypothetical protein